MLTRLSFVRPKVLSVLLLAAACLIMSACGSRRGSAEQASEPVGTQRAAIISLDAPTTVEAGTPGPVLTAKCPGMKLPDQCGTWAGVELQATRTADSKLGSTLGDEHCLCETIDFKIPAELPVTSGATGWSTDKATLTYRTASSLEVACRYRGNGKAPTTRAPGTPGTKYVFERCSDGSKVGQSKRSDWFELELGHGLPGQGATEVGLRLGEPDVVGGVLQEQVFYATDPRIAGAALHVPRGTAPAFEGFSLSVLSEVPLGTTIPNANLPATTIGLAVDVHASSTDEFAFTQVPGAPCPRIELPFDQPTLDAVAGPGAEGTIQAQQLTTLTGVTSGAQVLTSAGAVTVDLARRTFSFCVEHLSFYVGTSGSLKSDLITAIIDDGIDLMDVDLLSGEPLPGLIPGRSYQLKLGFYNDGGSLWLSSSTYLVGVGTPTYPPTYPASGDPTVEQLPTDPTVWSTPVKKQLSGNVATKATANFTLDLIAPATPQPLNLCLRNGLSTTLGYFGDCFSWDAPGALFGGLTPFPEAQPEVCDGFDNDLDGSIDEGLKNACNGCAALTNAPGTACENGQPGECARSGTYVCSGNDATICNAPAASPTTIYYPDSDGDGHGTDDAPGVAHCTPPPGYATDDTDCCDSDANAFAGQMASFIGPTNCGDFDFNCDGLPEACASGSCAPVTITTGLEQPFGIAVGGGKLYWVALDTDSDFTVDSQIFSMNLADGVITDISISVDDDVVCNSVGLGGQVVANASFVHWMSYVVCGKEHTPGSTATITGVAPLFYSGGNEGLGALAIGGNHVYNIERFDRYIHSSDGSRYDYFHGGGGGNVSALAADGTHLYWLQGSGPGAVFVYKHTAPALDQIPIAIASGQDFGYAMAVHNGFVYWTVPGETPSTGRVNRVGVNGGPVTTIASNQNNPSGLAVDSSGVYWANRHLNGSIVRAAHGGGTVLTVASGQNGAHGIALDASTIYWTNTEGGQVMRASK